MRRISTLLLLAAVAMCSAGCGSESSTSTRGGSSNASTTTGASNAAGTANVPNTNSGGSASSGPRDTGIGGTSDTGNTNTIPHNTNREPPGVNKNGSGGAPTSGNKP
jgi:hypothetical protein